MATRDTYTDPNTGTTYAGGTFSGKNYTAAQVAAQYGVNVPADQQAVSQTNNDYERFLGQPGSASPTTNKALYEQQQAAFYDSYNKAGSINQPNANITADQLLNNKTATPLAIQQKTPTGNTTPAEQLPNTPPSTQQPSPNTVNATPYTQNSPTAPATDTAAMKAAATTLSNSNAAVPTSEGAAAAALAANAPAVAPNTTNIDQALAADPGYQQLVADKQAYDSAANQSASLLDYYNQAIKDTGLASVNTQLINAKNVIDGTEQDIRNEVQAAQGFATDSQVMALANARNKTLIQNYNNLVDLQKSLTDQVNTMVSLAGQDRAFAMQQASQKLQIDQQIADYRTKFIANAQEGYKNTIAAIGFDGLYATVASDPNSVSLIEKTMGMTAGSLKAASDQAIQARIQAQQMQQLDIQAKQANIAQSKASAAASYASANASNANAAKTTLETQQLLNTAAQPPISTYTQQQNKSIIASVDNLIGRVSSTKTGILGSVFNLIPGSGAANFAADLDALKANIAFGQLNAMREASKTGGALGQVSDAEERLLTSALGSLSLKQSPAQMKTNLANIKNSIISWEQAMAGAGYGVTPSGDLVPLSSMPTQVGPQQ